MTAPFAPPPPRSLAIILLCMVVVGLVTPLMRRDDWMGWAAFLTVAAVALGMWGLLILGLLLAEERGEPLVEVDQLLGRGAHVVRCHGGSLLTKRSANDEPADSRVL